MYDLAEDYLFGKHYVGHILVGRECLVHVIYCVFVVKNWDGETWTSSFRTSIGVFFVCLES